MIEKLKTKPALRIVRSDDRLPYDRHETAADIAKRLRDNVKRRPMFERVGQ